jgi:broad specificity phosphatase PhoE
MKLIIVRHGETDRNKSETFIGSSDMALNALGQRQAVTVAKRLADETIDCIYSSDLIRARQTAAIIAKHHSESQQIVDEKLRERDSGIYAHLPVVAKKEAFKASGKHFRDWKPEGGESMREVKERARQWYEKHRVDDAQHTIVVVSHGLFLSTLMEWALEDGADVEKEEYRHHNTAVTILDVPLQGAANPIIVNDVSHLADVSGKGENL